jgi:RNA polymerase sigma-70 factor (ECF subfamily)
MLGTTTAAVKSALQRARARLEEVAPAAGHVTEPTEPHARALLEQYITAFENSDPAALTELLRKDATVEMTPSPTWFADGNAIAFAVAGLGSPGDWRMIPTLANGQPAAAAYRRGSDGIHHAYAIVVLTATVTGINRIVVFGDPGLFARFGLPPADPAVGAGTTGRTGLGRQADAGAGIARQGPCLHRNMPPSRDKDSG